MVEYFTDMTWGESIKDIIDILIVTYIIYQMILLVRGTRAVQSQRDFGAGGHLGAEHLV